LINVLAVEDGEIFVDAIVHDKDDPMCCPTLATTRNYLLNGVNLILTSYSTKTPTGELREINIEAPVEGAQISGSYAFWGISRLRPSRITLSIASMIWVGGTLRRACHCGGDRFGCTRHIRKGG